MDSVGSITSLPSTTSLLTTGTTLSSAVIRNVCGDPKVILTTPSPLTSTDVKGSRSRVSVNETPEPCTEAELLPTLTLIVSHPQNGMIAASENATATFEIRDISDFQSEKTWSGDIASLAFYVCQNPANRGDCKPAFSDDFPNHCPVI
jgi:hypothetical protein